MLVTCDRLLVFPRYSGTRHDIAEILLKVGLKQNNHDPLCFHDNCNQNLLSPLISGVTFIRYAQSQYIWKSLGAWNPKGIDKIIKIREGYLWLMQEYIYFRSTQSHFLCFVEFMLAELLFCLFCYSFYPCHLFAQKSLPIWVICAFVWHRSSVVSSITFLS